MTDRKANNGVLLLSAMTLFAWSVLCFGADIGNCTLPIPNDCACGPNCPCGPDCQCGANCQCEVSSLTPGVHPAVAALAMGMGDLAGNASTQPASAPQPVYFNGGFASNFASYGEPVAAAETVTFRRQGLFARIRANRQARIAARRGVMMVQSVPVQMVQYVPPPQPMRFQTVQFVPPAPALAAPSPATVQLPTFTAPQPVYREDCYIDAFGQRRCRLVRVQ